MALTILKTTRRVMWPYAVSVGLHIFLVAGLLYASFNRISPSVAVELPMSVTLVTPAPEPVAAPPRPVASPEPASVQPAPVPEPRPEPVAEPPAPVQLPKAKPKPKPVLHKEVKPRPRKESVPVAPAPADVPMHAAQAPERSGKVPVSAPATSASAADTGPVALNLPNPSYPDRARVLGIEGRVQIQFDVNGDGQVENLRIVSATPPNMFERDIREVTRRWRYQSGKPGKNLSKTIVFTLSGISSGGD